MPKVKVKLKEMVDANVDFISLVDRSSSRLPVRVLKADRSNGMIDLSNPRNLIARVLKSDPKAEQKPEITAVVTVDHGDLQSEVTEALKEVGFNVETVVKNDDGTVMYQQSENPTEGARLLKMSDDLLLVVKGFDQKWPGGTDQPEFDQEVEAAGYLPGVAVATAAMSSIVRKSDDAGKATVGEVVQKFGQYIADLSKVVPAKAFKAEEALALIVQKGKKKPMVKDPDGDGDNDMGGKDKDKDGKACKTEVVDTPPADATEAKPERTQMVEGEQLIALGKMIEGLTTQIGDAVKKVEDLSGQIEEVRKAQATSESRVDEAVKKFENASDRLKNVVLTPPVQESVQTQTKTVQKRDPRSEPLPPNFDSAIHGRPRR